MFTLLVSSILNMENIRLGHISSYFKGNHNIGWFFLKNSVKNIPWWYI